MFFAFQKNNKMALFLVLYCIWRDFSDHSLFPANTLGTGIDMPQINTSLKWDPQLNNLKELLI